MKNGLIIHLDNPSRWASCVTIADNLKQAYSKLNEKSFSLQGLLVNQEEVNRDLRGHTGYCRLLAEKIAAVNPQYLIFLDHLPHPIHILRELQKVAPDKFKKIKSLVHLYGDFSLFSPEWVTDSDFLKGHKVKFISASERQKNFVSQFLIRPKRGVVEYLPFPVDTSKFQFDSDLRMLARQKWQLTKSKVILYTGRLSLLKNIALILDDFCSVAVADRSLRLLLAGSIDDMGSPILKLDLPLGGHFALLEEKLRSFPQSVRSRIHFLGHQDIHQLQALYCAADLFYSPSLYHDEDFGMSPAEALSAGLPCVLTDWGGYSSFAKETLPVSLLKVFLREHGFVIDKENLLSSLDVLESSLVTDKDRSFYAKEFRKYFSVAAVSKKLFKVYERDHWEPFQGFASDLNEFAVFIRPHSGQHFHAKSSTIYEKYYGAYFV